MVFWPSQAFENDQYDPVRAFVVSSARMNDDCGIAAPLEAGSGKPRAGRWVRAFLGIGRARVIVETGDSVRLLVPKPRIWDVSGRE